MIRGIPDKETEFVWNGERSRKLPPDIEQTARRKLFQFDAATMPLEMRVPAGNRFEELKGKRKGTYSVRINDQRRITFRWITEMLTMSGARTTIAGEDRLDNVHPGDILREDFLIGSEISFAEVVAGAGIDRSALEEIVFSKRDIDASIDARLTRYFGMSEGFFLRLQNRFDIEEVRLREADQLARIVPRAA